ncbi:MAG: rhodanese-like domain-containing protein [Candidatus Marinimicrobia bacterium]|nr:rhodanese-like domain-containing protein [Candidatus Neomarinimicrobiota bacterium]MDP7060888.1 rhodanese-like domain-containing protein [Candidatus Neomarinimicrobiota bacterium]
MNTNTAMGQSAIILAVSFVFSFGFNMVRDDGLPLIATKQIIEGGQSTADSLLAETTLLFQPVMIDLAIAKSFYDRGVLFIDARDDKEFREGHIAGSKLAPANPGEILRWATEDDPVVTYCSGGECDLSMNLANELMGEDWGFARVFVFDGGLPQWIEAGYPVE